LEEINNSEAKNTGIQTELNTNKSAGEKVEIGLNTAEACEYTRQGRIIL
jgi:hypothetical protein